MTKNTPLTVKRRHPGRPTQLAELLRDDPGAYARMLELIAAGGYDGVAASFVGICPETFCRWMRRGREERRGPYRKFRQDVCRARAQARLQAELAVYRQDPKFWLRCGPARTQPGRPGWTDLPAGTAPEQDPAALGQQPARHEPSVPTPDL